MRDELLGTTQPMLSISLDPGESVLAEAGQFAWMTDSIQLTPGGVGSSAIADAGAGGDREHELPLCVYTAAGTAGVVAFAVPLPGSILGIEAADGYLIRRSGFLAGTRGVQVRPTHGDGLPLWRVSGSGRAWIGMPGDVVKHELTAGQSLRAQQEHIGMFGASVAIQVTDVHGICVLSGPGTVWLQSMPVPQIPLIPYSPAPPPPSASAQSRAGLGLRRGFQEAFYA
jgi:uncharacterized protein (AIM24 family)